MLTCTVKQLLGAIEEMVGYFDEELVNDYNEQYFIEKGYSETIRLIDLINDEDTELAHHGVALLMPIIYASNHYTTFVDAYIHRLLDVLNRDMFDAKPDVSEYLDVCIDRLKYRSDNVIADDAVHNAIMDEMKGMMNVNNMYALAKFIALITGVEDHAQQYPDFLDEFSINIVKEMIAIFVSMLVEWDNEKVDRKALVEYHVWRDARHNNFRHRIKL